MRARSILANDPSCPGSLGIAISEAVEDAATRGDTNYSLGSVLNHVLLHQTIIGQEAKDQMANVERYPDMVIGCVGGGSNFAGIALPFVRDRIAGNPVRFDRSGARILSNADKGRIPLRLRGHGEDDASAGDAHSGAQLHAPVDPCRRTAVPRNCAPS